MIKAIIFDFFGVLVTEGFKQFCDTYFPGDKQKRAQAIGYVNRHDAGFMSADDYMDGLAKLAGVGVGTVGKFMASNKPNTALLTYIRRELKPKFKISVLSNSGDDYINQMLEAGDVAIFDDVILSYRHGILKPQQEIFELAAKRLGVLTNECVFIDDSPNHCTGARQAGMEAIIYTDFDQMKDELSSLIKNNG